MNYKTYPFKEDNLEDVRELKYGTDWPVVYILNNENEAYVGETLDVYKRLKQHLMNPNRKDLDTVHLISDETFNKSVILDLESFLIKYMSADERFVLQNGNGGIYNHDYYERKKYEEKFSYIWNYLKRKNLVVKRIEEIENTDLFKYSPYKVLTEDQEQAIYQILMLIKQYEGTHDKPKIIVKGGAGTGKTILAVYLMKLLSELKTKDYFDVDDEDTDSIYSVAKDIKPLKIGFVVPMQSLRTTLKKVFNSVKGLSSSMVISPNDATKDHYDLLVVDEAHRLRQRVNLTNYKSHDDNNRRLGLGKDGTELDWVIKSSDMQILFYDNFQSIRPTDVDFETFEQLLNSNSVSIQLTSQLRCLGGEDYIEYVKKVLNCQQTERLTFKDYDLKLFSYIDALALQIKNKDEEFGLSRLVAGFSWPWKTKRSKVGTDITIENRKFIWNTTDQDWINSANAVNEIGCIHTVQGYDLNYAGIIFGEEIDYDPLSNKIIINKDKYFDTKGKVGVKDDDKLHEYIINVYLTLMTRGIKGTYVYACNKNLREYFKKYF